MCSTEQYTGNYGMQFCPVILEKPGLLFNLNYLSLHFFNFPGGGGQVTPLPMPAGAHGYRVITSSTKVKMFQMSLLSFSALSVAMYRLGMASILAITRTACYVSLRVPASLLAARAASFWLQQRASSASEP